MELKCTPACPSRDPSDAFNRTAYGIEIRSASASPATLFLSFNRTAYGIEILYGLSGK